ncbi:MAG TPA: RpiB/LacA/LacB family sugar-phosphate isomerase [Gemmatimonadaceae bacterium]|jgi:ribose 5-phosphate isomerase B|nr:RpiB/LacA/LacB family sugar-phosphate isomerase [Gemmatimonadaceae bacterium]
MNVALGTDHAGFALKATVVEAITALGHSVVDCGAMRIDPDDDYPDFAAAVAQAILDGRAERGVLLCGSGVGASVAANKFVGIRSALCHDTFSARQGVEDDAMNVLALGARVIGPALAVELVGAFLRAQFSGAERHRRRLAKIESFERG